MIAREWPRPARMVAEWASTFFRWWGRELAACIPDNLPARLGLDRLSIWILLRNGSAVVFNSRDPDRAVEFDFDSATPERLRNDIRDGVGSGPVGLIVPSDNVLRPTVNLPIAASENLREVIGFELDRHTPFRAEEVFYDFRIVETNRQSGMLSVELAVAPKEEIERALAVADAWGLAVDRITVADDKAPAGASFNLLAGAHVRQHRSSLRRLIAAEAGLICLLAVLAAFLHIKEKRDAVAAARAELAVVRSEAEAVGDIRDEMMALSSRIEFLITEKKTHPSAVSLLAEITRILPDGTWLSELNWDDTGLYIAGFSDQPSALIGALEASPLFSAARFDAPVTAAPQLDRERFDIALVIAAGEERQ